MNPRVKKLWLEALRSGAYTQGRHQLRSGNSYCCLGVLCDLHSKETGTSWEGERYIEELNGTPRTVADWAGLSDAVPTVLYERHRFSLSQLNDCGYSFEDIADIIDKQQL